MPYLFELINIENVNSVSIWSIYFMLLKSLLNKYLKLRAHFKKQNEGYESKEAKVYTNELFDRFLFETPGDTYLGMKVNLRLIKI